MSVEEELKSPPARPAPGPDAPAAIRVEDLHKSFRIPTQRVDSFKERAVHPFAAREYRELRALDGVSFEVRQGEFFGIVGRNGSGKSTLLKLLASIYRADSGRIQMAGRLAPFIELGVGFNQELTARENVVLNGVMMGLTPQESRERLDGVIEFAELGDFIDLKLKNYSSGMLVRLAFSLMLEVDADILLIDEVLAVGDAAFQQKCADAFREMKAAGKTIILVTHEMSTVEEYCHRAMLISDGQIQHIGDPGEVGRHYLRLNFERESDAGGQPTTYADGDEGVAVRLLGIGLRDEDGEPVQTVEAGNPLNVWLELEAAEDFEGLNVGFLVGDGDGVSIFQFATLVVREDGSQTVAKGERVRVEAKVENPLVPGHYFMHLGVNRTYEGGIALYAPKAIEFIVFGGHRQRAVVAVPFEMQAVVEEGEER
jgi:ABC-type polysaccharide/polyol phosphate transport system ATPase subunit